MKKIFSKNLLYIVIASFIIFTAFFIITSSSRADDEEESEDNYRQPAQVIQPAVEATQTQSAIPGLPVISQPTQVQTPAAISTGSTPVSSPRQTTTTINKETIIKVPDNSALLAALKDSDNDGIPDVIDKYPGEDDFAYYLTDNNKNGIADDLENLIK